MDGRCSLEAHRNGRGGCGVQRAEVRSSRTLTAAEGCGSGRVRDVAGEVREANQAWGGGQCLEDGEGSLESYLREKQNRPVFSWFLAWQRRGIGRRCVRWGVGVGREQEGRFLKPPVLRPLLRGEESCETWPEQSLDSASPLKGTARLGHIPAVAQCPWCGHLAQHWCHLHNSQSRCSLRARLHVRNEVLEHTGTPVLFHQGRCVMRKCLKIERHLTGISVVGYSFNSCWSHNLLFPWHRR